MRFREVRAEGKKITKYFEIINPARQNQVQVEGLRVLHFVLELSRSNDITTVDLKKATLYAYSNSDYLCFEKMLSVEQFTQITLYCNIHSYVENI